MFLGTADHSHGIAFLLFIFGLFSLFACLALMMRGGMAAGSGEPIPEDRDAAPEVRFAHWFVRSERKRIPALRVVSRAFLGLGLILLAAAGVTYLVSLA